MKADSVANSRCWFARAAVIRMMPEKMDGLMIRERKMRLRDGSPDLRRLLLRLGFNAQKPRLRQEGTRPEKPEHRSVPG